MPLITSAAGIALIHNNEACKLKAYWEGNCWTIGYGTTRYPNGDRVHQNDTCTIAQADAWFRYDLHKFETALDALTVDLADQRKADGLMSLVYNIGIEHYRTSTVRRRVNADSNDPTIRDAFMLWYRDIEAPENERGLWARRHREADFYFGVSTPEPPFPGD